jgi:hypothetical protein
MERERERIKLLQSKQVKEEEREQDRRLLGRK